MGRPRKYFTEEERRAAAVKAQMKWRKAHEEKFCEYQKQWREENPHYCKERYKKYKNRYSEINKKWRERNPNYYNEYFEAGEHKLKQKARVAVNNAIQYGKLAKQPCEVCGKLDAEAHHCDYNKPLDVMWLCKKHHTEWHESNTPKSN